VLRYFPASLIRGSELKRYRDARSRASGIETPDSSRIIVHAMIGGARRMTSESRDEDTVVYQHGPPSAAQAAMVAAIEDRSARITGVVNERE